MYTDSNVEYFLNVDAKPKLHGFCESSLKVLHAEVLYKKGSMILMTDEWSPKINKARGS